MDADPQDLSEIERRLATWRPGLDGLSPDAMLFAAGRAEGRRRWPWPALSAVALLAVGFASWALYERAERCALAALLTGLPAMPSATIPAESPVEPYVSSEYVQFSLRRRIEQDPDHWLKSPPTDGVPSTPPPEPVILRAGQLINQ